MNTSGKNAPAAAGPIANALTTQAPHLLASAPVIERVDVLGAKLPKSV